MATQRLTGEDLTVKCKSKVEPRRVESTWLSVRGWVWAGSPLQRYFWGSGADRSIV